MADVALGVVVAFDEAAGLGDVDLDDGRRLGFQATAIADGTRRIEPGTPVVVEVAASHRGCEEARWLERR
jgi:hypothetical protein